MFPTVRQKNFLNDNLGLSPLIEALASEMIASGASISVPLRQMPYGKELYVRDPDGYVLGFVEAQAER